MSKVKFIQIGSETLQYNDITPESGETIEGYKSKLGKALKDYPGAIIFGTYTENNEKKQEIWANGTSYSVGGGGGGTVYVGTATVKSDGKLDFTNGKKYYKDGWEQGSEFTQDGTFKEGDIYVQMQSENASALQSSGFVYSKKNRWEALAGSVNAENVWFPDGINRTEAWGTGKISNDVLTECEGRNLKDLFEYYLVKASFPKTSTSYLNDSAPSWSISNDSLPTLNVYSDSEYSTQVASDGIYEVGTSFYINGISYNMTTSAQQGQDTLITGATKTFTIGPSYITGIKYGFWPQSVFQAGPTKNNIINASDETLTFNGEDYKNGDTVIYTPTNTQKQATVQYTYTSDATSTLSLSTSGFTDSVESSSSSSATSTTLSARVLTVNNGTNQITLSVNNKNKWTASYSNNTIPQSDTVFIANNQYGAYVENEQGVSEAKSCQISQKTVTGKSNQSQGTNNCGTFKASGVYPVYISGTKQSISTVNNTNIKNKELIKPGNAGTAYYIETTVSATLQVFAGGVWGEHKKYTKTTVSKTDLAGRSVNYYKYTPTDQDGKGAQYKLV